MKIIPRKVLEYSQILFVFNQAFKLIEKEEEKIVKRWQTCSKTLIDSWANLILKQQKRVTCSLSKDFNQLKIMLKRKEWLKHVVLPSKL